MRLEGRKALVTGGASGIGAAIAARLAAEGAEVWVGDIDVDGAEKVAGEVAGHALELDVTDLESAQAAVEAAGTLDILVNNAGTDEFGFFTYTTPRAVAAGAGDQPRRRPQLHLRGAAGDAAGEDTAASSASPPRPAGSAPRARPSTRPPRAGSSPS